MTTYDGITVFPIPGYEETYSISKCGRVLSRKRDLWRWLRMGHSGEYSQVVLCSKEGRRTYLVHRLMGFTFLGLTDGLAIDHIDRCRSNNRLENLRVCSYAHNASNKPASEKTSRFKGVSLASGKRIKKWRAMVMGGGVRQKHIGNYATEEEAARAYDEKATELHGKYAVLNFPSADG